MTPLEHNKYLGLSHLVYGVIHILFTGISMLFVGFMFSRMRFPNVPDRSSPMPMMMLFMGAGLIVNVLLSIPSFVAGYALLKRRSWARVMGIVAAVIEAMHFPFGTAVCAYTFWFLFSEPGKILYSGASRHLPPPPPANWVAPDQLPETRSYTPPLSPPDWR